MSQVLEICEYSEVSGTGLIQIHNNYTNVCKYTICHSRTSKY